MRATLSIAHDIEIRPAVPADVPAIVAMGRRFHAVSPYAALAEYDEDALEAVFYRMIASKDATIIVAGEDEPVGCIGLLVTPLFFAPGMKVCNELFWWVDPEERGCGMDLATTGEHWARLAGADIFAMSSIAEIEGARVDRLLERRGMTKTETTFMKALH